VKQQQPPRAAHLPGTARSRRIAARRAAVINEAAVKRAAEAEAKAVKHVLDDDAGLGNGVEKKRKKKRS
jgi:hypothetical protein